VAQNHEDEMRLTPLAPGLHLVSNLDVDDPTCPKIARSHERFAAAGAAFAADRDEARLRAALHAIVSDHTRLELNCERALRMSKYTRSGLWRRSVRY